MYFWRETISDFKLEQVFGAESDAYLDWVKKSKSASKSRVNLKLVMCSSSKLSFSSLKSIFSSSEFKLCKLRIELFKPQIDLFELKSQPFHDQNRAY